MQKALAIYKDLGQKRGEAIVLNNIATIFLQNGDHALALESALKSLELARENGFSALLDCVYGTVGEVYMETGEYGQAAEYLYLFQEHARRNGALIILVWALTLLGRLHHYRNDDAAGLPYLEEALETSRSSGFLVEQAACLDLLTEIFERQGKYKKALLYFKQFHILTETIYNQEKQRKIAQLESVFEIETFKEEAEKLHQRSAELQKEVNERRQAQAALEELATLDPLTNLLNRRHFYALADHALEYAHRTHHQLSIIMIDIDQFKKVNDSYGHIVGDQVLSKIGEFLQRYTRNSDVVARYGGEEFVVLLPETSIHEAWQMAERLRLEIAAASFPTRCNQFSITVSMGIADLPEGSRFRLDEMLDWADQALYGAKQSGRNNTVVYQHRA
jgi:diguanylate cyclase (GGDEF)-like protein